MEEITQRIHEFNVILDEDTAEFPCRADFKKTGEALGSIKSAILRETLPVGKINETKGLLDELHGILQECREHKNENCAGKITALSMRRKLRKLRKRLEEIMGGGANGAGAAADGEGDQPQETSLPVEIPDYQWTSSFIEREKIYGMDAQVDKVVNDLVKPISPLISVGIVGMQGSGKTALAQKVFTDDRVLDRFALRLWVCVTPHKCKPREVLRRMLDSLGLDLDEVSRVVKDSNLEEVGALLFILYTALLDNSYLIVFDDVRNSDHDSWYRDLSLRAPIDREWTHRLAYGLPKDDDLGEDDDDVGKVRRDDDLGRGGAVVVTSRSEDVARAMVGSGGKIHRLSPLQDELLEEGWSVLKAAFQNEAPELKMETQWEDMKRLIVEKCNGLPLALEVAGRELARLKKKEAEADQATKKNEAEAAATAQADATPVKPAGASVPAPSEATPVERPDTGLAIDPSHPTSPREAPAQVSDTNHPLLPPPAWEPQLGAATSPPESPSVQTDDSPPTSPDGGSYYPEPSDEALVFL